jgi:hypothetical protein
MNREEKRRRAAIERSGRYVESYVRHLPQLEAMVPGAINHTVFEHDGWCDLLNGKSERCNCSPDVKIYAEPVRS